MLFQLTTHTDSGLSSANIYLDEISTSYFEFSSPDFSTSDALEVVAEQRNVRPKSSNHFFKGFSHEQAPSICIRSSISFQLTVIACVGGRSLKARGDANIQSDAAGFGSSTAVSVSDQVPQVSLYDHLTPKSLGSVYSEIEWTYLVLLDAGLPEMEAYRIALDSILYADFY